MIADLIEGNLKNHPVRTRLLQGRTRKVDILAMDIETRVGLVIGNGSVIVTGRELPDPVLAIRTDSETLLDLPRAKLMLGFPSLADPIGRGVTRKMLTGKLKIRGILHLGVLTRVQRLLSVA